MNIPAIETGVLPPLDGYLDRDNNIPLEDGDQPPPPPPVETDSIWHHGHPIPYGVDAPNDGDHQPPITPPSPGLSYHTSRTPSLRHKSVTPSHHSSGGSRSRSQTLTEQMKSPPHMSEHADDSGFYCDWIVTMSDSTTQVRPLSPVMAAKLVDTYRAPENPRILAQHQALESPSVS